MQHFIIGLSISLAVLASSARAGEVTHSTSVGPLAIGGTSTVTMPPFDASLGILRNARIACSASITGTLSYENTDVLALGFGGFGSGQGVGMWVPVEVTGLGPMSVARPFFDVPPTFLAGYDGVIDYAGASGITFTFANHTGTGPFSTAIGLFEDAQLQLVSGPNPISIKVEPVAQDGGLGFGSVLCTSSLTVSATLSVRYQFDTLPTRICGTTASSGCPCNNHSPVGNGAGCRNSASPGGGNLVASGSASIANDTLTLSGSSMPNSSALYFQGTNFRYDQAVYGDGLKCVTGTLRRLGMRANVLGASEVPGLGGTPISAIGAIGAPGTRYYQIVYRDFGSYCTAATSNVTSGMAIVWTL